MSIFTAAMPFLNSSGGGAIVRGVGSLLSGAFGGGGSRQSKRQKNAEFRAELQQLRNQAATMWQNQSMLRYQDNLARNNTRDQMTLLRQSAEQAGFNPLTALGVPPAQAGTATMSPSPLATYESGGESRGARIVNSLARILSDYDPIRTETTRLQNQLAEMQIAQAKNETARLGTSVPSMRQTTSPVENVAQVLTADQGDAANFARKAAEIRRGQDGIMDPRILRDDGMGGVEPAELEADAYGAALQDEIWPYGRELFDGNNPEASRFLDATFRRLPNPWTISADIWEGIHSRRQAKQDRRAKRAARSRITPPDDRMDARAARRYRPGLSY